MEKRSNLKKMYACVCSGRFAYFPKAWINLQRKNNYTHRRKRERERESPLGSLLQKRTTENDEKLFRLSLTGTRPHTHQDKDDIQHAHLCISEERKEWKHSDDDRKKGSRWTNDSLWCDWIWRQATLGKKEEEAGKIGKQTKKHWTKSKKRTKFTFMSTNSPSRPAWMVKKEACKMRTSNGCGRAEKVLRMWNPRILKWLRNAHTHTHTIRWQLTKCATLWSIKLNECPLNQKRPQKRHFGQAHGNSWKTMERKSLAKASWRQNKDRLIHFQTMKMAKALISRKRRRPRRNIRRICTRSSRKICLISSRRERTAADNFIISIPKIRFRIKWSAKLFAMRLCGWNDANTFACLGPMEIITAPSKQGGNGDSKIKEKTFR